MSAPGVVRLRWDFGETPQFRRIYGSITLPEDLEPHELQDVINQSFGRQYIHVKEARSDDRAAPIDIEKSFTSNDLQHKTLWLDLPSGPQKYVPARENDGDDLPMTHIRWKLNNSNVTGIIAVSPFLSAMEIENRFKDFFQQPIVLTQNVSNLKSFSGLGFYPNRLALRTAAVIASVGSLSLTVTPRERKKSRKTKEHLF